MSSACGHFRIPAASPEVRELGLGAAALVYASLGYAVLPLQRGGKRPSRMLGDTGGVHHASADPGRIAAWWREDKAAGIGVACGGVLILDLDRKNGHDGVKEFSRFLSGQSPGHLLGVPSVRTPSGGVHIWLRWDPAWGTAPNRAGVLPGVDTRGAGGYVCAPPSMLLLSDAHSGESVPVPYRWAGCPCSVPPAPGWVPGWLARAPGQGGAYGGCGGEDPPDLAAAMRDGLARGSRDTQAHRLACAGYRRHGTGPEGRAKVEAEMLAVWQATADKRDFGWGQMRKCLRSALAWVSGQMAAEQAQRETWMRWLA